MMKDIIITVKRQKAELRVLLGCFVVAELLNIISIIAYHTPAKEIVTQIFWVLTLTAFFYALSILFRLIFSGIKYLLNRKK